MFNAEAIHPGETSPMHNEGRAPLRFDVDAVVHRSANPMLAAEMTLGGLDRNVAANTLMRLMKEPEFTGRPSVRPLDRDSLIARPKSATLPGERD
jgi:hypothetical protein